MTAPSGSARIRISADVDPALADAIDRTMRRARDSVDRRMREAGDSSAREAGRMGREFDAAYRQMEQAANRVNASRAREESAIARVQAAQQRANAAAMQGTQARIAAANQLRAAEQAAADAAAKRRDAESNFAQRRREVIDIDTRINDAGAIRGMTRLRAQLQSAASRPIRQNIEIWTTGLGNVLKITGGILALVTALGSLGLAGGAAVIPIAALTASLTTMAGATLALPGILAGVVTVLATAVVGFTGLGEAIKQTNAAQAAAGQQAEATARAQEQQARAVERAQKQVISARRGVITAERQVESAVRQVTSAERTLASAHKTSERAQVALTRAREDATRSMRDLNYEVRQGALDEGSAVRELDRARRDLANIGSYATAEDREDAQARVDQAELSLERLRSANGDLAEEQKKRILEDIEGNESVVAAREAVADATQGITDAEVGLADAHRSVADAQIGVSDAMEAVSEAQRAVIDAQNQSVTASNAAADKADEAMSKLSANGRELVNTLVGLKPRWLELRNDVQDALLVGVGGAITELVTNRLPLLASGMSAIAGGINVGLTGSIGALSNPEGGAALAILLRNSAEAARDLGVFLGPAVQALFNLFAIGSDYLPGLTQGLEGVGQAFLAWSRDGDAVRSTIDAGIAVARQWGEVLTDVGVIIGNVFGAANASGSGTGGLGIVLDQLAAWTGSAEGQDALVSFFTSVRQAIDAVTPVLLTFMEIIGRLAPHAANILEALMPFVDQVLVALGDALDQIGPYLPDLADAFGQVLISLVPLMPLMAELAIAIIPPLADGLRFIAPFLAPIAAAFLAIKIALTGLGSLLGPLSSIAGVVGAIAVAIGGMIARMVLFRVVVAILQSLGPVGAAAARVFQVLWYVMNPLSGVLRLLTIGARALIGTLLGALGPIGWAVAALAALAAGAVWAYKNVDWFREAVDTAVRAVGDAFVWMWQNVWQPILGFLWGAIQWVGNAVIWWWQNITVPALRGIGDAFSWVWNSVVRPIIGLWMDWIRFLGSVVIWLWQNVVQPVWDGIGRTISWVVNNVVLPSFRLMSDAVRAVGDAFAKAVDWIGQMWDRIKGIAARPVRFVVETVYNNGIRAVWNKVAGWLGLAELPEVGLGSLGSYARGGTLPGHSPGRDTYRFIDPRSGMSIDLGGGEGILTTRTNDKLRRSGISVEALNAWGEGRGGSGGAGAGGLHLGGYALGGTIDRRLWELVRSRFPGLTLTSALRPGDPGYHGRGMAVDVSNGSAPTPLMNQAATYFRSAYGGQLAELIYGPFGGNNIKNGRPLNYGAATNQQHMNHVHLAATSVLGEPGAAAPEGDGFFGSMFGFMRNAVANAAESILNPIGERIPSFGNGLMGQVPRKAFDHMQDKVVGFLRGKADAVDAESGAAALGGYGGNAQFYIAEMVRAVKDMGMDKLAAVIAAATMLVETNLKMYANRNDPASLNFPYDAIGSDHDSSGLYQQRNNGAWGTIAERMNPYASSIMFLRQLKKFAYWAMDPGAAAQRVQVSAFPGKYAQRMAEARALVDPVFDSGGIAYGRGLMMKDVIRPERVLDPTQTEAFDRLVDALTLRGNGGVNIGGLSLSGDGSVTIRPAGPGGSGSVGAGGSINVNVDVKITAQTGAEAATELAATINSLITV